MARQNLQKAFQSYGLGILITKWAQLKSQLKTFHILRLLKVGQCAQKALKMEKMLNNAVFT